MNISSQLFDGVVNQQRSSAYTATIARSATPGQTLHLANGERCRVVGKTASAKGNILRIARSGHGGEVLITSRQLAALSPIPSVIRRFASMISVLAFDQNLGSYVTSAIDQAGLPQDPDMKWGQWLTFKYRKRLLNYTQDEDLIDDAIREVLIHELYEKRILETNFDPKYVRKPTPPPVPKPGEKPPPPRPPQPEALNKRVSSYLTFILTQDVNVAVEYVQKTLGVGMKGYGGRAPTESLTFSDAYGDEVEDDRNPLLKSEDREGERLGNDELVGFLEAFKEWFHQKRQREVTVKAIDFITDRMMRGEARQDIREEAISPKSKLRGRDGKPYNDESWKKIMQAWAQWLLSFADSSNNSYRDTGLAKAVLQRAKEVADEKAKKKEEKVKAKPQPVTSGLHMALDDTGKLPHAPYSNNTEATTVVDTPPPPTNPNVQQQQTSIQNKNNAASPQEQQIAQGEDDTQKPTTRVTIPPEIPGVNHA